MALKRAQNLAALVLTGPFVATYAVLFVYPTVKLAMLSLTDGPLIGEGNWVGVKNYFDLFDNRAFIKSSVNTFYFVVLTVVPTTVLALVFALMVNRLKGWMQSVVLACFFLPYILPVSVVYIIWQWVLDLQFGVAQHVLELVAGRRVSLLLEINSSMPTIAFVTIWWTNGFNVLLFIAGLRNIPQDYYDAASLDGATTLRKFIHITLPLIWPVAALVLTIQLILQLKIFDQVYLFTRGSGGPANATLTTVLYIYKQAFQLDRAGVGATVAMLLFLVIVVFSIVQYRVLRGRREA